MEVGQHLLLSIVSTQSMEGMFLCFCYYYFGGYVKRQEALLWTSKSRVKSDPSQTTVSNMAQLTMWTCACE